MMRTINEFGATNDRISNKVEKSNKVVHSNGKKVAAMDFDVSDVSSDEEDKGSKPTGQRSSKKENIIEIQVIDPATKKRATFKCEKGLLL